MSERSRKSQNTIRMQLELVELTINAGWNYRDPAFLKWKRHYLLKRLLALQLEEIREDLEGKCHALWLYNRGETEKWNGMGCDCKWMQGNLLCKLNTY